MAHNHTHSHAPADYGRAFAIGVTLNLGFVLLEFGYGWLANSLALIADAGHNLSDVAALVIAWGATILARRAPTPTRTYGWRRSSILAALINATLLLVAVGAIGLEAFQRLRDPAPVASGIVIWVAMVGIIINTATALMFMRGREHDINIRGAFLHMAADAGVSLGVVIAGFIMLATGWTWVDPVMSLIIAGVILVSTWDLLRDSVNMALDAVPPGIDLGQVDAYLRALPGVASIHDLHVWNMSTTEAALTAHLVAPDGAGDALLCQAADDLHDRFGIEHTTLQIELGDGDYDCRQAAEGSV